MPAPGPNAPLRPPSMCSQCQTHRVAWTYPRVDFCYDCLPGGPFTPPPCSRCGTSTRYFSQGLCEICHPGSPQHPGSCKDCFAWGVYRRYNWTCWTCRWWRSHFPEGICNYCGRTTHVAEQGACRLCLEHARMCQEPGHALDLNAARAGQQLFLANMLRPRSKTPRPTSRRTRDPWRAKYKNYLPYAPGTSFDANAGVQLTLFDIAPDTGAVRQRVLVEDSDLTRYCASIVNEHATQFGWSARQRNDVIRSLRLLQTLRTTPTAKIRASEVLQLPRYGGNITSTIDVLAVAELLIDDRPSRVERYFASKTSELPPVIRQQLEVWLDVMTNGATRAPRQRARGPHTVEQHIMAIAPLIQNWAAAGHQSLAEITTEQIRQALPDERGRRYLAYSGFRSLFKTLKSRRLIFADPMRGVPPVGTATNIPLALDPAVIRALLNSADPAIALAVALIAFHALTNLRLRQLRLTDISDGRLDIDGRSIPLAAPVRTRLAVWLDYRARRWPDTANPHLIINRRTAPRLTMIGNNYPWCDTTIRPRHLREDRILNEIHATGGDIRRICDLFGLSVSGATRYLGALEHPDLTSGGERIGRT